MSLAFPLLTLRVFKTNQNKNLNVSIKPERSIFTEAENKQLKMLDDEENK